MHATKSKNTGLAAGQNVRQVTKPPLFQQVTDHHRGGAGRPGRGRKAPPAASAGRAIDVGPQPDESADQGTEQVG
jgi:hypothetical protein